jgi:hypothetical protein
VECNEHVKRNQVDFDRLVLNVAKALRALMLAFAPLRSVHGAI